MSAHEQCPDEPCTNSMGHVYRVPNTHLDINVVENMDHYCVFTGCDEKQRFAFLHKGTSKIKPKYKAFYTIVEPNLEENGLSKPTAFEHIPKIVKLHKVKLYYPERHIGKLNQSDLERLLGAIQQGLA